MVKGIGTGGTQNVVRLGEGVSLDGVVVGDILVINDGRELVTKLNDSHVETLERGDIRYGCNYVFKHVRRLKNYSVGGSGKVEWGSMVGVVFRRHDKYSALAGQLEEAGL